MKITALEEYGLRCLLHVARTGVEPVSAQVVAEREGLSLPYTQKILRILAQGGLIESKRGVHGGYVLTRSPERMSVGDAIRALGGMFEVDEICERYTGELQSCAHGCHCTLKPVWSHISEFVIRTLDNISIAVLLGDQKAVSIFLKKLAPPPETLFCPVA